MSMSRVVNFVFLTMMVVGVALAGWLWWDSNKDD